MGYTHTHYPEGNLLAKGRTNDSVVPSRMSSTAAGPKSTALAGGPGPALDGRQHPQDVASSRNSDGYSDDITRRNSAEVDKNRKDDEVAVEMGHNGVDVQAAKADFAQTERKLSRIASMPRALTRSSSKGAPQDPSFNPEKGGDVGEEFDLLDFLVRVKALHGVKPSAVASLPTREEPFMANLLHLNRARLAVPYSQIAI